MSDYFDVQALFNQNLPSWKTLVSDTSNPYQTVLELLRLFLYLPEADTQSPILALYLLANTKWSRCLPVLFDYGSEGTGKSTAAILAKNLHGCEILSATSTYASTRNAIKTARYLNPEDEEEEADGAVLLWDNVDLSTFDDKDILNVLLNGYKRGTDLITISSVVSGVNIQFRCFCSKMMSSVWPIHQRVELKELRRRMLVVFHERSSVELDDMAEYSWDGLYEEFYYPIWQDSIKARTYHKHWLNIKKLAFSNPAWSSPRKEICRDLIALGCVMGAYDHPSEGIALFTKYWEYHDLRCGNGGAELVQFIEEHLKDRNKVLHSEIAIQIELWTGNKQLIGKPRAQDILAAMTELGFKKELDIWVKDK